MSSAEHYRHRVTVVGPNGPQQAELAGDKPVSDLLPEVQALVGLPVSELASPQGWELTDGNGTALAPEATLASQGIWPGSVLMLRRVQAPPARSLTTDLLGLGSAGQASAPAEDDPRGKGLSGDRNGTGATATVTATRADRPGEGTSSRRPDNGGDEVLGPRHVTHPGVRAVSPTDGMTPLERVDSLLPVRMSLLSRLLTALRTMFPVVSLGSGSHAAVPAMMAAPLGHSTLPGRPGVPDAPAIPAVSASSAMTATSAAAAAARRQAGRHRLLPADLTVAVPPSKLEQFRAVWHETDYLTQLDALIAEPRLHRCATIAVVSPKGGVGKTTITALLGTLLSLLRHDPIVAVDTNPDFGSLGRVLTPDQFWCVDDLAKLVKDTEGLSLTALGSRLGRAVHGLLVVPAPRDPARLADLDEDGYLQLITRLKDFFSLILLDCGTGLQDPSSAAAIAAADQVVLLTDAQPATASLVAESIELLYQWGRPITVVVNRMPSRGSRLDLFQLSRHLPAARGVVVIPDDTRAATRLAGSSFAWRDAPASWQAALRRLAVVLVSDWQRLGLAQQPRGPLNAP